MKVLLIASEAVPFIKTGGLADVIGSLPLELRKLGIEARVILPNYGDIPLQFKEKMVLRKKLIITMGWRYHQCSIFELKRDGINFYFIDNDYFFNRSGLYGFYDDAERFAFLCRATLEALPYIDFLPRILHCHDWHTGLVPVFLKARYGSDLFYKDIRTLFTIHNLEYQGLFPLDLLQELLELGDEYFTTEGLEYFGEGSYLKGGLVFADFLSTVSKTYSEEIQGSYYGLSGLLRARRENLVDILNGLDYQSYDPMSDTEIFVPYRNSLAKKRKNKLKLQETLGLPKGENIPVITFINRLVEQKGLDLITDAMEEILSMDLQLIFLGMGLKKYEKFLAGMAWHNPQKLSLNLFYDDSLARKIYAGSDMLLLPSLFEPCGICQLIAMRYGTIPIVRETGGLKYTVQAFDESEMEGNGFTFADFNARDMLSTIKRAVDFYGDKKAWSVLVRNAVKRDYSWSGPAQQYRDLYRHILEI